MLLQTLQHQQHYKISRSNTHSQNTLRKAPFANNNDLFTQNVSFKQSHYKNKNKIYTSGDYTRSEVDFAKQHLGQDNWEQKVTTTPFDHNEGLLTILGPALFLVATNILEDRRSNRIKNISKLMCDMKSLQFQEILRREALNSEIIKQSTKISEDAKEELKSEFIVPIQLEKVGKKQIIPNCILIEGRNDLMKWLTANLDYHNIEFSANPNDPDETFYRLQTEAQYSEERFQKNKIRTLIHIKDFDKLLTSTETNESFIADVKNLLDTLSKDNHCTIVFQTYDSSKIDPIILQPHRTGIKIKLDNSFLSEYENLEPIDTNVKPDTQPIIDKTIGTFFREVEKTFKSKFVDLVANGKDLEANKIPNCILIEGNNMFIDLLLGDNSLKRSNIHKEIFEYSPTRPDDIVSLKKEAELAEERFKKDGKRTLIFIQTYWSVLISDPKIKKDVNEIKELLDTITGKGHCTLLFQANDFSRIDQNTLKPYNVLKLNATFPF